MISCPLLALLTISCVTRSSPSLSPLPPPMPMPMLSVRLASFTTFGDTLWLTAIRAVGEGERLSIDYGNNFYLPTAERQAELEDIYGFVCTCRACTVLPDRCRAFRCRSKDCRSGKVCPHGDGESGEDGSSSSPRNWGCLDCGRQCPPEEIEMLLEAEESLAQALEEADELGVWCMCVCVCVCLRVGEGKYRGEGGGFHV